MSDSRFYSANTLEELFKKTRHPDFEQAKHAAQSICAAAKNKAPNIHSLIIDEVSKGNPLICYLQAQQAMVQTGLINSSPIPIELLLVIDMHDHDQITKCLNQGMDGPYMELKKAVGMILVEEHKLERKTNIASR